jgi:hypothetical protein
MFRVIDVQTSKRKGPRFLLIYTLNNAENYRSLEHS